MKRFWPGQAAFDARTYKTVGCSPGELVQFDPGEGGGGGLGGVGGRNALFTLYRLRGNRLTLIREAPANAGLSGTNSPSTVAK